MEAKNKDVELTARLSDMAGRELALQDVGSTYRIVIDAIDRGDREAAKMQLVAILGVEACYTAHRIDMVTHLMDKVDMEPKSVKHWLSELMPNMLSIVFNECHKDLGRMLEMKITYIELDKPRNKQG
jgi:hypothetical protein